LTYFGLIIISESISPNVRKWLDVVL
jgi:hypothetical protein